MTALIVEDTLAEHLKQLAQQEERSIDALLRSMLASYAADEQPSDWPRVIAQMAEADTDIEWSADAVDLSGNSRETLEREFGDYLLKRLGDSDNNPA